MDFLMTNNRQKTYDLATLVNTKKFQHDPKKFVWLHLDIDGIIISRFKSSQLIKNTAPATL